MGRDHKNELEEESREIVVYPRIMLLPDHTFRVPNRLL